MKHDLHVGCTKGVVRNSCTGQAWPDDKSPEWEAMEFGFAFIGNGQPLKIFEQGKSAHFRINLAAMQRGLRVKRYRKEGKCISATFALQICNLGQLSRLYFCLVPPQVYDFLLQLVLHCLGLFFISKTSSSISFSKCYILSFSR